MTLGAVGGTAAAVRLGAQGGDPRGGLTTSGAVPPRHVELPLAAQFPGHARGGGASPRVSGVLDVGRVRQVAVTWRGEPPEGLELRTRSDSGWSDWLPAPPTEHRDTDEGNGRLGSDLLWVDDADAVQVRMRGPAPRELTLVAIEPGWLPTDEEPELALMSAPAPRLRWRYMWGANESLRSSPPVYDGVVARVHVHHTASSNYYSRADVPAMIRGMYRYHTRSLGWSDIGYNFLVDRFGRSWVGRAGGPGRAVRGAHTRGFNRRSTGIAAIGNFQYVVPSKAMVTAIVRLSAWKLGSYGFNPNSWALVRSDGSDRFPAGRWVRLPRIDGHRDTNHTACPGRHLYGRLPEIRRRAQMCDNYFS